MRSLAQYVMLGRRQAIIAALICTFIPLFGWVGAAIMALVTLRKGVMEGGIVLLWISLPAVVIAVFGNTQPLIDDVLYGGVLVWLLAIVLSQWSSWNMVLQVMALLGGLSVLISHAIHPDITANWVTILTTIFTQLQKNWAAPMSPEELKIIVQTLAKVATGVQTVFILSGTLTSLLFARWWQAVLYNPGGLQKELYQLRLNYIAALVLIIVGIIAASGVEVFLDVMPVLLFPFFIVGLSIVHSFAGSVKSRWFWLFMLYGLLIVFFPQVSLLLVLVAFLDIWFDFRQRFGLKY